MPVSPCSSIIEILADFRFEFLFVPSLKIDKGERKKAKGDGAELRHPGMSEG